MRTGLGSIAVLSALVPVARSQPFGFVHQTIPAEGSSGVGFALPDVDGDGDLDAFLTNGLYLNDGSGVFVDVTGTNLPPTPSGWGGGVPGDVDGDGDLDAFGGTRLYLNVGGGVFTDVTATNLPAPPPLVAVYLRGGALGDVDGDGDLDAFLGAAVDFFGGGGQERLYLNDGTGVFADVTAANLPPVGDDTRDVALGDVDGDGDLDAFTGNMWPDREGLFLNGGTGVFTDATATSLPLVTDDTRRVALRDVDGDGDLDALTGNTSCNGVSCYGGQIRLYLNGGPGVFTDATATSLPSMQTATQATALGDVDGDGDSDVYVGVSADYPPNGGNQNRLLLNQGTGVFMDATATNLPVLLDDTGAVALGDVDGDGDLDAFIGNGRAGGGEQDRLQLNDGAGVFTDVTAASLPLQVAVTYALVLGDLDADGDPDAFMGGYGPNRLSLNDGTGFFADATATNLPVVPPPSVPGALGDVDGDGDLDAFLAGQSRLFLNSGAAVFTDVTATNLPPGSFGGSVALGDVDGDGDVDAFLGNVGQERLYLNGGAGVFADVTATNFPVSVDFTQTVALGDVDGDGDLDAFTGDFGGSLGGQDRLYGNSGTGVFTDVTATSLPPSLGATVDIALGDVDRDGDLDAFAAYGGYTSVGQHHLYQNDGTGVFTDVAGTNLPPFVDGASSVVLADADGDGDLDAFLASWQERLYRNDGTGVFTDVTATELPSLPEWSPAAAAGDVDGDGDVDFVTGSLQDRILTNLSRQLAWRGVPRVGKPLALDLWGPPNGSWLLAASAASAGIPLPPFGTLRLDPSTLLIVAGGSLDSQGRASLAFPVPANSTLVGLSLYWQAVAGSPLRFTNLEITTVTGL